MKYTSKYYNFTRCPLNDFARENGYIEILPVCCEMDHYMTEAKHGVLHRDYTLATGGELSAITGLYQIKL